MKILVADLLFQRGNRHVDSIIMDGLAEKHQVFVLRDENDYPFEMGNRDKITFLYNKYSNNSNNPLLYKIQILQRMFFAAKKSKELKIDVIIFSVYDARVVPFALYAFNKKSKIIVIENDNIDLLENFIYRVCYKIFANKVHHIVYEEYFGEYLHTKHNVSKDKIHRVPHALFEEKKVEGDSQFVDSLAECIAISYSNDESFIGQVIEYEINNHFFENNKIKCRIKSRMHNYRSQYLFVDDGFIPIEEYDSLYSNCSVVLVPFPKAYKYRMSGSVIDAFSHHKKVVATGFELAKQYNYLYGNIIETYDELEKMLNAIKVICEENDRDLDFSKYEEEHSKINVKQSMEKVIEACTGYVTK